MNKDKIWLSITIALAICLTICTLSYFVTEPWHVMPGLWGDSPKNYFTYIYQCAYGKGFWFEGMNYPYGEHIVYTDGQPLLSLLLTSFHNVNPSIALTTLWLLIGVSYVLSAIYNYKILIHFKVSQPIATVFAGLISILSPQVFRIIAQFSLAYICVMPMLFYWTIKYHESSLRKYCVYIFLLGIITAFLHPYFAGMMMLWTISYITGYFVFTRINIKQKIKHITPMLISIASVLATIAITMWITDPVKDRPVNPYGVLANTTNVSDIVISGFSPVWQYIIDHKIFGNALTNVSLDGEGYDYIGIVTALALIFSLAAGIIHILRKNKAGILVSREGFSPIWLFMAFSTLLLSMGIPFIWHMEWLLDYVSVLRQFRTIGRFSWMFYYIISIYAIIVIYNGYKKLVARRGFFMGGLLLFLCVGLWSFEASGYIKYIRNIADKGRDNYDIFFSTSGQDWKSFLQTTHLTNNDFQAILMLNFYHVGSEKLWIGEAGMQMTCAAKAAFELHLPIVDVMMSRTSLSQTENQVKIAGGPYVVKPILSELKNDKPFLLLTYDNDTIENDQKYLLQASDYIGHYFRCKVYAFYPLRQAENDKRNLDSVAKILPFMTRTDTCVVNKGDWYVNHLDNVHAESNFFGSGAMPCISGEDSNIAMIPIKPVNDKQEYEFSCWFLLSDKDCRYPCVFLESLDSSGHVIATTVMETKYSVDNHNLWFRGAVYFYPGANCKTIRCRLSRGSIPSYKIMDEIQLRPSDALIISKAKDGSFMVNNHFFKKYK